MLSWISNAASSIASFVNSLTGGGSGGGTPANNALANLWNVLKALFTFLQTLFGREMGAWQFAHKQMIGGGDGLSQLSDSTRYAIDRLMYVIIPNSLAWLDGRTHQWVTAKYDPQIKALNKSLDQAWNEILTLDKWRLQHVDPELKILAEFLKWFNTYPRADIEQWHRWFAHPSEFADWACAPLIGPTIVYYATPAHKQSRDNLTAIIVAAMPDVPTVDDTMIFTYLLEAK